MVLDGYRRFADRILIPIASRMLFIEPNTLTVVAFLMAVIASILFYLGGIFFLLASLFVFLNASFDALDGKIAKLANKTSHRGDFLDHVLDRYADVFIIGGIMLSAYCNDIIGFFAVLAVIFASYMGTQAQAVGAGRDYSGILGRADRLVILTIMPIIHYILLLQNIQTIPIAGWSFTFVELVMFWFIIAGNVTAIQRGVSTWRELKRKEGTKPQG
jgi:archaetidylinositol phosphate synthase